MTGIINAMFKFRFFPGRWKQANVIFIPKPGKNQSFSQNDRPISLLSSVEKIAERVIRKLLSEILNDIGILTDEQFGFLPHHSTSDQFLRVVELATKSIEWKPKPKLSTVFDMRNLFTSYTLQAMVQIIDSFLDARTFRAPIGHTLSAKHPKSTGAPEGPALSPVLYAIFSADIPKHPQTSLAIYTDDTVIVVRFKLAYNVITYLQAVTDTLE